MYSSVNMNSTLPQLNASTASETFLRTIKHKSLSVVLHLTPNILQLFPCISKKQIKFCLMFSCSLRGFKDTYLYIHLVKSNRYLVSPPVQRDYLFLLDHNLRASCLVYLFSFGEITVTGSPQQMNQLSFQSLRSGSQFLFFQFFP